MAHCYVCLVAGVGGKLSRPVYLDPKPPEYQRRIILLILLISNYQIVKMLWMLLGQDKLAWTAYPPPLQLNIPNNATKKTAEFDLSYVYY